MVFPSIISCENDLEIINYFVTKPNFITKKSLSGNIENISISNSQDISGKIILLENADPGYDWIFTQNPLALITKYGGAASHMAIRCSEINLPAAIGCGDLIYQKLLNANKVLLDCSNEQIIILDSSSPDEESEIKKTLKSIGYIK
jgi:phosphoenolpyruvate-protein kinase (PTS system EI component)